MTVEADMRSILAETPRYQTHTWQGQQLNQGIRGVERRQFIRPEDLKGRRVLDLGCATGAECFWALEQGATKVCGVEQVPKTAEDAGRLVTASSLGAKLSVICHDLRKGLPSEVASQDWDTVFAFAIIQHTQYQKLWEQVGGVTVVYVESGAPCPWGDDVGVLLRQGWQGAMIGSTPNNLEDPRRDRRLFRLVKQKP